MDPEVGHPPTRPRWLFFTALSLLVLTLIAGTFFFVRARQQNHFVSGLVEDPSANLHNSDGRTNLVFLGLGGETHQAGDLTDSMIFLSLSHHDQSLTIISVPRDIWVETMRAKINTAYHYGNERREGGGLDLAKSAVAEITGQPVHYALALDFNGFVQAIDAVGGIDVDVERTFDDFEYPVPGQENAEPESDRYEHLHFDQGITHMDGELALKFARSRHAEGDEGTDFARSKRQQKILLAFKDKLIRSENLLNLDKLREISTGLRSSVDTDIEDDELASLFRFFLAFDKGGQSTRSLSLDDYLTTPRDRTPYLGQWVLAPIASWEDLHAYVAENLAR
jgi:LCP family protein required for cell wall assembly